MTDVYIGFMDEEVRPILAALQTKGWNVLVIERGNIDPQGVLFERPISAYGYGVMWKGWCGLSDKSDPTRKIIFEPNTINSEKISDSRRIWLNVFQQCMLINLQETLNKLPARILENEKGRSIKRKLGLIPSVSMLYMGNAEGRAGGLPTKILIRSPEMGLQPGLIRTQLRGILKALKSAGNASPDDSDSSERDKINIWSYGAGGAYSESPTGGPGTLWDAIGSLYIGVERDKSAELRRVSENIPLFAGEISYCSDKDNVTLYNTPTFYTIEEARRVIESIFIKESKREASLLHKQASALAVDRGHDKLKKGITITSNSFMGADVKSAAKNYKLCGDVNMEDFHLYKLIHSLLASQVNFTSVKRIEAKYPLINKTKIIRIDADPATLPEGESFADLFKTANPSDIPITHYAAIIKWGLEGMDLTHAPDELNWGKVPTLEGIEGNLIPYKGLNETAKYMNPFLLEAAQDLFREVGEWLGKYFRESDPKNKQKTLNNNPFNVKTLLVQARETEQKINALQTSYEDLKNNLGRFCINKNTPIDINLCGIFIASLYDLLLNKKKDDLLPIWARAGWGAGDNDPYITANASFFGAGNTNIDRALYKSNNSVILDKNALEAVTTFFTSASKELI